MTIPVVASNRINMPAEAEGILPRGDADMVSMARPFLADADFVAKAAPGRADEINTCIACNQACLDHTFAQARQLPGQPARLPRDGTGIRATGQPRKRRGGRRRAGRPVGGHGGGRMRPRRHAVRIQRQLGGQFKIAMRIPGKEEFAETMRYFRRQIECTGVKLKLGVRVDARELIAGGYDEVVVATGIKAAQADNRRHRSSEGASYIDVLQSKAPVGKRVAIIGAGGIGFDVAEYLLHDPSIAALATGCLGQRVGGRLKGDTRGGLVARRRRRRCEGLSDAAQDVQAGRGPGQDAGWVHRADLRATAW